MSAPEKHTELFVGLFVFTGLVLLGGLIVQFSRFNEHFGGHYSLTVVFDDASGLIKGSEIRMGGAQIGRVAETPALNAAVQVEVELSITDKVRIPAGSSYQIASATLLGDKLIIITPPDERNGDFVQAGSRHTGKGPSGFEALQNNAEILSRDISRIIEKAESTLGNIDGAANEIGAASRQLKEAVSKVNGSLLADENLTHIDETLNNLAELSRDWKQASGALEPTIAEAREAIGEIRQATATANKALGKADDVIAELKPAIEEVPNAVNQIARTAKKAGDALDRMEKGEGLLGTVSSDKEVSTDAKVFVKNLRRYGILRYRNDETATEDDPRNRYRGKRR